MPQRRPTKDEIGRVLSEAVRLHRSGRPDRAVSLYEQVRPFIAKDPEALRLYSVALIGVGRVKQSLAEIDRAIKLKPMHAQYRVDRARLLTTAGRYEEGLVEAERALAIGKGFPPAVHAKVMALRRLGRSGEAYAWLRPMLDGSAQPDVMLVDALAELAGEAEDAGEVATLIERALAGVQDRDARQPLLFKLGELLDRAGRYEDAFRAIEEANASHHTRFDAELHREQTRELIESWKDGAAPAGVNADARPVFVMGVPRSGTSLVEQILSMHPEVAAAGETVETIRSIRTLGVGREPFGYVFQLGGVSESDLARVGARMMEHLAKISGGSGSRLLTDKMPENVMHIGFLASLFPNARFVHCQRDLRDTCLSCYFQDFSGSLHYAFDLESCASYAADAIEHARHWKGVLHDRIHTVRYEQLVGDHESTVRSLLSYLDLEFDEACLRHERSERRVRTASFEQANQPIYTGSLERWRRYERELAPAIEVLRERGELVD